MQLPLNEGTAIRNRLVHLGSALALDCLIFFAAVQKRVLKLTGVAFKGLNKVPLIVYDILGHVGHKTGLLGDITIAMP